MKQFSAFTLRNCAKTAPTSNTTSWWPTSWWWVCSPSWSWSHWTCWWFARSTRPTRSVREWPRDSRGTSLSRQCWSRSYSFFSFVTVSNSLLIALRWDIHYAYTFKSDIYLFAYLNSLKHVKNFKTAFSYFVYFFNTYKRSPYFFQRKNTYSKKI